MIKRYVKESKTEIFCAMPFAGFLILVSDVIFPGSEPVIILTLTSFITTSKLYNFVKDNVI